MDNTTTFHCGAKVSMWELLTDCDWRGCMERANLFRKMCVNHTIEMENGFLFVGLPFMGTKNGSPKWADGTQMIIQV